MALTKTPTRRPKSGRVLQAALAFGLAAALVVAIPAGAANSIQSPDTAGDVGSFSSVALDNVGNPVVSYYDFTNFDLKIAHCNDPYCAGGDESITSPDIAGDVGGYTSLALDGAGNPVVSYFDFTNEDLKILHCNDPNCAGGDESITSPDTAGFAGTQTSLTLDAGGNPVVSYASDVGLKILHCDDPSCTGAGESIETQANFGRGTSLALDGLGNPVVSYYDFSNLRILHCDDPNCAGFDIDVIADNVGSVGSFRFTSLALDAAGNPVVSYLSFGGVKILHCNNPFCTSGFPVPLDDGDFGTSLALDGAGNPVVSYHDFTDGLKIAHCNDPNCFGGDESIESPDSASAAGPLDFGRFTSLELDGAGNPVVSYYDAANHDLKVLHCDNPACAADTTPPMTTIALAPASPDGNNGWYVSAVTVTVSATDVGGSGVAETRCVLDPAVAPASFDDLPTAVCPYLGGGATVSTDGEHTVYAASSDNLGNEESPVVSASFRIDQTAPTLNPQFSAHPIELNAVGVTADPNASDTGSGVASESCDPVDTSSVGVKTLYCRATDNAGNSTGEVAVEYLVGYRLLGLAPAPNSTWRKGSKVSIKVALTDANGVRIPDAQALALLSPTCRVKVTASGAQTLAPTCMKYVTNGDYFRFDWKLRQPVGAVTITVTVGYPGSAETTTLSVPIVITS